MATVLTNRPTVHSILFWYCRIKMFILDTIRIIITVLSVCMISLPKASKPCIMIFVIIFIRLEIVSFLLLKLYISISEQRQPATEFGSSVNISVQVPIMFLLLHDI